MSDAPPVADPPAAAPEKEPPSEPPAGDKDTPERGAEEKEATDKEAEEKAAKEKDAAEKETKEKEPPVPIPASSLPAVTTDHESPKPVQRTFTTPAGQSVTVIEHAAPPTEHTVLVDKPAPSTETITVIDRPAPTTETITVVKEQAPVTEHITITEHPAPKTEKITIVDNSAPKKEQITISNNAAPKTEQITIVGTPKPPGVVEEKKKEGIAIVDVKPSVIKKPSIVQAVNPPETIVEEQHPSSSSIDTVLVASKPKAASVVVIPTVEKSIQPERARTVHEQVSALPLVPAAQLSALATPVGVFTDYIAPTETVLILQAHAFSLRRQDYSITDEAGNKVHISSPLPHLHTVLPWLKSTLRSSTSPANSSRPHTATVLATLKANRSGISDAATSTGHDNGAWIPTAFVVSISYLAAARCTHTSSKLLITIPPSGNCSSPAHWFRAVSCIWAPAKPARSLHAWKPVPNRSLERRVRLVRWVGTLGDCRTACVWLKDSTWRQRVRCAWRWTRGGARGCEGGRG